MDDPFETKPQTRADCRSMPRPCPFVSCRHHLYLDITRQNRINVNRLVDDMPVEEALLEMPETCSLDVAEKDELPRPRDGRGYLDLPTYGEVGKLFGIKHDGVRKVELRALRKIGESEALEVFYEFFSNG